MKKLKTLTTLFKEEEEDDHQITISFPDEIIQDILSRLPIKPILQFRSVSKQWLSFISHDPSFPKLHFNHSHRTALLISAYDSATGKRHFLSAPPDGGPVTHLITLDDAPSTSSAIAPPSTSVRHLNGLVLITSSSPKSQCSLAFVINPATRKVFKLPAPKKFGPCSYFFGFHQSRNEHYVLSVRKPPPYYLNPKSPVDVTDIIQDPLEFMIYSLSTYSWRKIDVKEEELPVDITRERWRYGPISSVCVDSVIHLMLENCKKILAFDLTTEKFSTIDIPGDAIPRDRRVRNFRSNHSYLMDINGFLGLVCHDRLVKRNEMYFWILQDYDGRVWVKETVTISESWFILNALSPINFVDMDKIVFSVRWSGVGVTVPIYDMKTRGFKFVQFTPGQHCSRSKTMRFSQVRSYVESILPLEKNEGLHEDDK